MSPSGSAVNAAKQSFSSAVRGAHRRRPQTLQALARATAHCAVETLESRTLLSATALNEFLDFNDNQVPDGWQIRILHGPGTNASVANERFESRQVDTYAELSKDVQFSTDTVLRVGYDTSVENVYWGMGTQIHLYDASDNYVTVYTGKAGYGSQQMGVGSRLETSQGATTYLANNYPADYGQYHVDGVFRNGSVDLTVVKAGSVTPVYQGSISTPGLDMDQVTRISLYAFTTSGAPAWFDNVSIATGAQTVLQPGPDTGKDIWTTSVYSYAPGGGGPGGGLDNELLRVGGWADEYRSLLQFNLSSAPMQAESAILQLYSTPTGTDTGSPTAMYLDRIAEAWDWKTSGTGSDNVRLWWADRPDSVQWLSGTLAAPTSNAWYSIDITDLYNAWQDGTYSNYGLQLRPVSTANDFNSFWSSDYSVNQALRPRIVIVGAATQRLSAPTEVQASDGTFADHIHVSWKSVDGATSYEILRSVSADPSIAQSLGTTGTTTFDDQPPTQDTRYNYWVRAIGTGGYSDFSDVAVGSTHDSVPPTAALTWPHALSIVGKDTLNGLGYIEVTFGDTGGSGLDYLSIFDDGNEFALSGSAASKVVVSGAPMFLLGSTFRYTFSGKFAQGPVTAVFGPGTWADLAGNANQQYVATFDVATKSAADLPALGSLSEKYETSGGGPGTISSGKGDPGGKSYGLYQFSLTRGTVAAFVTQYYPGQFAGLAAGTSDFDALWRQLAREQPTQFAQAQFLFTKQSYYDVQVAKLQADIGLDIVARTRALQNVIWSTAVQHGARTSLVNLALQPLLQLTSIDSITDEQIIRAIYAERSRTNASGVPVYFVSSSKTVQQSVLKRFALELQDALSQLRLEQQLV